MKLETYDKIEARTRTCELRDIDNHYHHRSQKKHHLFRSESPSFRFINVSGSLKGIYLFSSSLIFVWPTVLIILPMLHARLVIFFSSSLRCHGHSINVAHILQPRLIESHIFDIFIVSIIGQEAWKRIETTNSHVFLTIALAGSDPIDAPVDGTQR